MAIEPGAVQSAAMFVAASMNPKAPEVRGRYMARPVVPGAMLLPTMVQPEKALA